MLNYQSRLTYVEVIANQVQNLLCVIEEDCFPESRCF